AACGPRVWFVALRSARSRCSTPQPAARAAARAASRNPWSLSLRSHSRAKLVRSFSSRGRTISRPASSTKSVRGAAAESSEHVEPRATPVFLGHSTRLAPRCQAQEGRRLVAEWDSAGAECAQRSHEDAGVPPVVTATLEALRISPAGEDAP